MKAKVIKLAAYYREHTIIWLLHLGLFWFWCLVVALLAYNLLPPLGVLVFQITAGIVTALCMIWVWKHRAEIDGKKID